MPSFRIIFPPDALRPFVRYYWTMAQCDDVIEAERVVPMGCVQLFFHRGDSTMVQTECGIQPQAFVSGQKTGYFHVHASHSTDVIVAVLQPYAAKLILRCPADLFIDANIPVEELSDAEFSMLAQKVRDESDVEKGIDLINLFLRYRIYDSDLYMIKRLTSVIDKVNADSAATVTGLSDVACLSQRQFNRSFRENFGLSPKEYLRIIRFQRAIRQMRRNGTGNLAMIAAECGYYDQSHMNREFLQFCGLTPYRYATSVQQLFSDYFDTPR